MHDRTKRLGIALDIGTTTIQGKLIDLREKRGLSYFSCLNEQLTFGHDIISRIKFSLEKKDGLEKLHRRIISSINFIVKSLLDAAGEKRNDISLITAVSNAALYHFILSLSPKKLVEPPYQPEYRAFVKKDAADLGIEVDGPCEFNLLPNIGGFVGSDAIAVILAAEIDKSEAPVLAVDLGTNGEIILGSKEKILVASTAAGPAFEGWHVRCGMRAVEGAIESVGERDGRLDLKVIGNGTPMGISGSALIDIIALLLKKGSIDKAGRMKRDYLIYDGNKKISLSQDDVRQVQLAKSVFSTGVKILRRRLREDITRVFITGTFGNYINKDNAKTIGLIPQDIEPERAEFLANGALKGSEIFIKDKESAMLRIDDILGKTEHVSLKEDPDFQKEFISSMRF